MANPAYGVKLIGKRGPWRMGVIGARDDGGGSQDGIGAESSGDPARAGYFGVARATYDIGENSSLGLLYTHHGRDAYDGALPALYGPGAVEAGGHNFVLAADAKLRLAHNLFLTGQAGASVTRVDSRHLARGPPMRHRSSHAADDPQLRDADGATVILPNDNY